MPIYGWGSFSWGATPWGSFSEDDTEWEWSGRAVVAIDGQGSEIRAKDDTVFLGESTSGTLSEMATDLSQNGADFTVGGGRFYDNTSPDSSYASTGTWCVDAKVACDNTDSGTIWSVYDSGGLVREILLSSGTLTFKVDDSSIGTVDIPSVSGSTEEIAISWAHVANPLSTGASDASLSSITVYNIDQEDYDCTQILHAAPASTTPTLVIFGSQQSAANLFSGAWRIARYSAGREHTPTEAYEDLVTQTGGWGSVYRKRLQKWTPDQNSTIADENKFAGPGYLLAGYAARQNDLRQVSTILGEVYRYGDSPTIGADAAADIGITNGDEDEDAAFADVADPNYIHVLPFMRWRPIPPVVKKLRARVQIIKHANSGTSDLDVYVRCYANTDNPASSGVQSSHTSEVLAHLDYTVIDTPEWLDLGLFDPVRDDEGGALFTLAFNWTVTGATWFQIVAWSIEGLVIDGSEDE